MKRSLLGFGRWDLVWHWGLGFRFFINMSLVLKQRSVLPGFGLSLGFTLLYLSLIVLVPLAAILMRTMQISWEEFWTTITRADVVAALWLSFFAAFIAAVVNTVFGLAV